MQVSIVGRLDLHLGLVREMNDEVRDHDRGQDRQRLHAKDDGENDGSESGSPKKGEDEPQLVANGATREAEEGVQLSTVLES